MPLTAELDGVDITEWCQKLTWRPRHNLLDSGIVRVPAQAFTVTPGDSRLALELNGTLKFDGPVWYPQAEGNPDSVYTEVTAYDDRVYLQKLLCKTATGNLITPGQVLLDEITAPEILRAFITNALGDTDAATFDPSGAFGPTGPSAPLPIVLGTVDTGGADVSGVPTSFPMSIDRMRHLLVATGQLDQTITPNGDGTSTLDLLNDYDNDLSGTVLFEYATGAFNCQIATYTLDMKDMINALWYLLGPRVTETRWRGSITPTAPNTVQDWPTSLLQRIADSRALYGYMQEISVFDDKGDEDSIRPLFEEEWANEAWIRAIPRTFASIRPERGIAPTNFRVGDLIGVAAGAILNGGFSGAEMVYGFDLSTDHDGVDEIEEILTSADQVDAPGSGA